MAAKDIEIELRFPLRNPGEVSAFLDSRGKKVLASSAQKDTYYVPAHRDFLNVKYPYEWLRLRETQSGSSLNYKHFYPENSEVTDYCDEFETKVDKPESMRKILAGINMREVVVVSKVRSSWLFMDTEVAVDRVEGLGDFIELEAAKPFDSAREAKAHLRDVLKEVKADVGAEVLRGYPFLLLEKKGHRDLFRLKTK